MSIQRNFHLAKCPFGETLLRRNGFDEMGFGEILVKWISAVSLLEKDKRRNKSIYLLKGA
jgi:hypothetical protein